MTTEVQDPFYFYDRLFGWWRIIVVVAAIFTMGVSVGRIIEQCQPAETR